VNRSNNGFTTEKGAIRTGLGAIKGFPESSIELLLRQRQARGEFKSLNDFLARIAIGKQEMESLILSGAFDFTGRIRPQLLWELRMTFDTEKRARDGNKLFRGNFHARRPPDLNDLEIFEKLNHELELLELCADRHVLSYLRPSLQRSNGLDSRAIRDRIGKTIRLIGMLDATRTVDTVRGETMEFLTLEDEYGLWECTMFPSVYRKYARIIGPWGPYLIEGRVEEQYGAVSVNINRLKLLGT